MPLYRNAYYWFIALLIVLVIGFWQTYFSLLGAETDQVHVTHHFHAVTMLAWVFLLITQSWLIRNRRNAQHRTIGRLSFVIAPFVVISGVMVVFYSQGRAEDPLAPFSQSILWFGFFSAGLFAYLYSQAIVHRKTMQLHARYMVATALVFIVPGLSRSVLNYLAQTGIWVPTFYQMTWVPFFVCLWMMFSDWRSGSTMRPYLVFNVLWAINLALWVVLPTWAWWRAFSAWSATVWY